MTTIIDTHTEECTHYWIIEPANGPQSKGECNICHEERMFFNYAIPTSVFASVRRPIGDNEN